MGETRLKIQHIITGLSAGGAQSALHTLIRHSRTSCVHSVISLKDDAPMGPRISRLGVTVRSVQLQRTGPLGFGQVVAEIRRFEPDVVHTWLYHADLLGGLAARALRVPAVWHLHVSDLDPSGLPLATQVIARSCVAASHVLPKHIVACSEATARFHASVGYAPMEVIDNGVDTERFTPERKHAGALESDRFTVGLVARFDPQKDVRTFVEAAKRFNVPNARFVLAGEGMDDSNETLTRWIGDDSRFVRLPFRSDIENLYPHFDVFSLSSVSEASSMSLLEAMASGAIPVLTDVGDARRVVASAGRVVPPRDPQALADAWKAVHHESERQRMERSREARERIVNDFSAQENARRFEALYRRVVSRPWRSSRGR
ncbi:MAG: glycosyltransferase [Myxococcota bacterium]